MPSTSRAGLIYSAGLALRLADFAGLADLDLERGDALRLLLAGVRERDLDTGDRLRLLDTGLRLRLLLAERERERLRALRLRDRDRLSRERLLLHHQPHTAPISTH